MLCKKGYKFTTLKDRLFCHKLVMDYCYVALDFEKELERIESLGVPLHEIVMEDGCVLELDKECIMATEILFNPRLVGLDEDDIISLFLAQGIMDVSGEAPFMLTGRCASGLKGLVERIHRELEPFNRGFIEYPRKIIQVNIREDAVRCMLELSG
mmetsp:Transcript_14651/g.17113  ORF Transcript_14651/g.17113 Transcript_14651/m.17113 type:complete len:155 (+) Transcript_14651:720-1184(+)